MTNTITNQKKIKLSVKFTFFLICVFALSLFFEGVRAVQHEFTLYSMLFLIAAVIFNGIVLFFQAFLIYFEENLRGNLKKRVPIFENLINYFQAKKLSLKEANKHRES